MVTGLSANVHHVNHNYVYCIIYNICNAYMSVFQMDWNNIMNLWIACCKQFSFSWIMNEWHLKFKFIFDGYYARKSLLMVYVYEMWSTQWLFCTLAMRNIFPFTSLLNYFIIYWRNVTTIRRSMRWNRCLFSTGKGKNDSQNAADDGDWAEPLQNQTETLTKHQ